MTERKKFSFLRSGLMGSSTMPLGTAGISGHAHVHGDHCHHDHGHVHDENCKHDHGDSHAHVHDENCKHGHE